MQIISVEGEYYEVATMDERCCNNCLFQEDMSTYSTKCPRLDGNRVCILLDGSNHTSGTYFPTRMDPLHVDILLAEDKVELVSRSTLEEALGRLTGVKRSIP